MRDPSEAGVVMPKIMTRQVLPPIPIRSFGWMAHYEGHEEGGYGFGATEAEAIADLKENCEEPDGDI